jgi:hypothetical protein
VHFEITLRVLIGTDIAGKLCGDFIGTDSNDDKMINLPEITRIRIEWLQAAIGFDPTDFTLDQDNTGDPSFPPGYTFPAGGSLFVYHTPAHPSTPDTIQGLDLFDTEDDGPRCQDGSGLPAPCLSGQQLFLSLSDVEGLYLIPPDGICIGTACSSQPPAVIPEPGTWLLLSTGLIGMLGYAFSRRVRRAAPRRTPIAGA